MTSVRWTEGGKSSRRCVSTSGPSEKSRSRSEWCCTSSILFMVLFCFFRRTQLAQIKCFLIKTQITVRIQNQEEPCFHPNTLPLSVCVPPRMKEVRLAVLKDLYWRRTQAQDRATNKRLDLLCTQLQEELDVKRQKNHHNYYRGEAVANARSKSRLLLPNIRIRKTLLSLMTGNRL